MLWWRTWQKHGNIFKKKKDFLLKNIDVLIELKKKKKKKKKKNLLKLFFKKKFKFFFI